MSRSWQPSDRRVNAEEDLFPDYNPRLQGVTDDLKETDETQCVFVRLQEFEAKTGVYSENVCALSAATTHVCVEKSGNITLQKHPIMLMMWTRADASSEQIAAYRVWITKPIYRRYIHGSSISRVRLLYDSMQVCLQTPSARKNMHVAMQLLKVLLSNQHDPKSLHKVSDILIPKHMKCFDIFDAIFSSQPLYSLGVNIDSQAPAIPSTFSFGIPPSNPKASNFWRETRSLADYELEDEPGDHGYAHDRNAVAFSEQEEEYYDHTDNDKNTTTTLTFFVTLTYKEGKLFSSAKTTENHATSSIERQAGGSMQKAPLKNPRTRLKRSPSKKAVVRR